MDFMFKDIDFYKSFLDFLKVKNRAIASNLANAETPFYKRLKVELMKREGDIPLKTTNVRHISNIPQKPFEYKILQDKSGLTGADGNNVNVEREMVDLEKVALKYELVTKFMQGKFSSLEMVIKGTGG
ncbi:MAG TPA: flagellar basal body rod protein FlgB [Aquificales bacterium]|uniref:Flagellar basal body rod protein FlgB n=1 Tax=Aquifex aeolicus TaxID=63363 RepID=A0A9D1CFY2_AQUAO|nr:flagellar basal body rod protein FlgB [Aquificales bacterium]HIP86219.1 flagellar basal body rod protein FlgB [Aquifex sp.]HIP97928.1 flagellar basal body rod protein FlgB [Aquifex aeolicus]